MHARKRLHLRSFDYLGLHRYALTFCTNARQPHFVREEAVAVAWSQISRASKEHAFVVIAYCFMPDHLHLLVAGNHEASDLPRFVTHAKQYSGFHFAQRFGTRLWQRYSYERVLRAEEAAQAVVRYILENPVRKGLVTTPTAYPFSGSGVFSLEELVDYVQITRAG